MRTGPQAVAEARRHDHWQSQYCLNFVQSMLAAPWSGPSAVWAWDNGHGKHGPDPAPPPGAPIWILGSRYGHIALSVGDGRCRSTDYPGRGRVGEIGIHDLANLWGRRYVGWATHLGGQRIPGLTDEPEDDTMPITDADAKKIAREVWKYQLQTGFQKDGTYTAGNKRKVRSATLLAEGTGWAARLLNRR